MTISRNRRLVFFGLFKDDFIFVFGRLLTLRIGELGGEFERIRGRAPPVSEVLLRELLLILVGDPANSRNFYFLIIIYLSAKREALL